LASLFGTNPSAARDFLLNPLPTEFLCDITYSDPQKPDWHHLISNFIVYGELDFIRFVHWNLILLIPFVRASCFRSLTGNIFDFDDYNRLRRPSEARSRGVSDIFNRSDSNDQLPRERTPQIRCIDAIIY